MDNRGAQAAHGGSSRGWQALRIAALVCAVAVVPATATTVAKKKQMARTAFDQAQRLREELRDNSPRERTQADYLRVTDAYRRVYYIAPTSNRADDSVFAVAELLAEQGRNFDQEKMSRAAIGQYEFLRREYPGSHLRGAARFNIAEIYADDLDDAALARETFDDFLKHYPQSPLVAAARKALAQLATNAAAAKSARTGKRVGKTARIGQVAEPFSLQAERPAAAPQRGSQRASADSPKTDSAKSDSPSRADLPPGVRAAAQQADAAVDALDGRKPSRRESPDATPARTTAKTAAETASARPSKNPAMEVAATSVPDEVAAEPPSASDGSASRKGKLARVTGIRHWTTPDYTRIAVDLDDQVTYEVGRVPSPDRLFFDLHSTRLPHELIGKEYDIQDGLLKKVRVAQFQPGETRIVFDLGEIADYQAFLLPNPYRLIIDVHGKKQPSQAAKLPAPEPCRDAACRPTSPQQAAKSPAKPAKTEVPAPEIAKTSAEPPKSVPTVDVASKSDAAKKPAPKLPVTVASADPETVPVKLPDTTAPAKSDAGKKPPAGSAATASEIASGDSDTVRAADPPPAPVAHRKAKNSKSAVVVPVVREAQPTSAGDRSLIRALGLKIGRIVVDAGHGGHDTGTIGPSGLLEKDLVLDVALRLGKLLEARLGADVVYTRDDDTFIPLETRTAIANREQADLFISVHANSSRDADARGVETYYLNFTTSADALEVAARENAVSDTSVHELQDLVKKIALKEKIEESREFAADVQQSLRSGLSGRGASMRDRGVKKAPFIVLIGANMPSILAEISFLSNPGDERRLKTPEYRQKIAESLYRGVQRYASGLSGIKVASSTPKTAAP